MDPHVIVFGVLTLGVGYVMAQAGVLKNTLEWRRNTRVCPSCGRQINSRVCRACTS